MRTRCQEISLSILSKMPDVVEMARTIFIWFYEASRDQHSTFWSNNNLSATAACSWPHRARTVNFRANELWPVLRVRRVWRSSVELELATTTRRKPFRNCSRIPCGRVPGDLPSPLLQLREVCHRASALSYNLFDGVCNVRDNIRTG